MKLVSISSILICLITYANAQTGIITGKCLNLETSCFANDDERTPCRDIPQGFGDQKSPTSITISAMWCNNSGKTREITGDSKLKIKGPAITSIYGEKPLVLPAPASTLANGECDEESWTVPINTLEDFFTYEVGIQTDLANCRGYFFTRQMKTNCNVEGTINCRLADGRKCEDYDGPNLIVNQATKDCPDEVICIDQTPESCFQDVEYTFNLMNENDQRVEFDRKKPRIAISMIAWQKIFRNNRNFAPLEAYKSRTWTRTVSVNICAGIPSARIDIWGDVIDSKTKKRDEDFKVCSKRKDQKVRKFVKEDGSMYPFCSDVRKVPCPKDKGGNCFCPSVVSKKGDK